ncbi:radical SAM protein [Pararhodospirillum photometricum]|uniref:radical SAM protein n=1 Tax=Pararhodospirillum photometricum TaxID=1084 RepID=UPI0012FEC9C1|nr:radical SAM protein [Pararhodospirillum photometricum]
MADPWADLDETVLLVAPERGRVFRLIRPGPGRDNTLLLTEACDQACLFCAQPPRPRHHAFWDLYRTAVRLAPAGAVIGLTGGEPLLLKDSLFSWVLDCHAERPDLGFHLLTNAQGVTAADVPTLRALAGWVLWGVPLCGPDAASHDAMVRKAGAWDRLLESLDFLAQTGAAVELRTVLAAPTLVRLPRLADFVARHLPWVETWALMHMEAQGLARRFWESLAVAPEDAFDTLGPALSIAQTAGLPISLYNFPRCLVPEAWRPLAVASISDWKRAYGPECEACSERPGCSGFFASNPPPGGFPS